MRHVKSTVARVFEWLAPGLWLRSRIRRRDRNFEREYFFIADLCDSQRLSIDAGGNVGEFAFWMSYHSRRVISYEPNPICQRRIRRILRPNITLRPAALSDAPGSASLLFPEDNLGLGSIAAGNPIFGHAGKSGYAAITVPTVRLDEDVTEPVGLIKIDVEGHEATVLDGATALLARDRPRIMIEIEERHGAGAHHQVRRRLEPSGYRRFILCSTGLMPLDWEADAAVLQAAPAESPDYVNNFIFIHRDDPYLDGLRDGSR
ncbi:FkbM family methyltransferase (plasmid) [Thalassobaculum sp. OXR-137]|uniref:FkbM family methyltransferase n=1 Tax=Thalassobaculum sp. OXR-137 TaxID=3100173 RepID=UPI002AC932D2|nr:FkbM family methyltransferase [Thalassobaculum sp. OXR-137]WPZ37228.1 FkbM family methyltransferase [Thalassobaculum sp. OXR-137]